jgi:hypothetical protein
VLVVLVLFPVCPDFVLRYPPQESGTAAAATYWRERERERERENKDDWVLFSSSISRFDDDVGE